MCDLRCFTAAKHAIYVGSVDSKVRGTKHETHFDDVRGDRPSGGGNGVCATPGGKASGRPKNGAGTEPDRCPEGGGQVDVPADPAGYAAGSGSAQADPARVGNGGKSQRHRGNREALGEAGAVGGAVDRRQDGNRAVYSIKLPMVFELCDLVCRGIADQAAERAAALGR